MQVKFGSIVTAGVGKLGGHQFQRGRGATQLVTKRSGTKRKVSGSSFQNQYFRQVANWWHDLNNFEKQEWIDWAARGVGYDDPFGNEAYFNPFQLFLDCNLWLARTGQPPNRDASPPSSQIRLSFTSTDNEWSLSTTTAIIGIKGGWNNKYGIVYGCIFKPGASQAGFERRKRIVPNYGSPNAQTARVDLRDFPGYRDMRIGSVVRISAVWVQPQGFRTIVRDGKYATIISEEEL